MIGVRMHEEMQDLIKNWAAKQNDRPSLAFSIRAGLWSLAEGEEMTVTGMRELEEAAVKLEASARKPALDDGRVADLRLLLCPDAFGRTVAVSACGSAP